jgi:hypothetical protein
LENKWEDGEEPKTDFLCAEDKEEERKKVEANCGKAPDPPPAAAAPAKPADAAAKPADAAAKPADAAAKPAADAAKAAGRRRRLVYSLE